MGHLDMIEQVIVRAMGSPIRESYTGAFLFTDVQGSTQRWEQHPAWMEQAHRRHEAILRAAIAAHGGWAYKQIGVTIRIYSGIIWLWPSTSVGARRGQGDSRKVVSWGDPLTQVPCIEAEIRRLIELGPRDLIAEAPGRLVLLGHE